jgi:nucleotide-binding universal stress UspA family protein
MAKKNNAELIALNVIHILYSPSYVWRPVIPNTTNSIIKKQEEEAERWLAIVREKANDKKIKLRTEFIIDPTSIVGAIVDYAERENIDLFQSFVNSYNYEREHGGINGMTPAEKFMKCLKQPLLIH